MILANENTDYSNKILQKRIDAAYGALMNTNTSC